MKFENSLSFAKQLDKQDKLKSFRSRFHLPKVNGKEAIYLTGNSLGLQPKTARKLVEQEFADWQKLGVEGHLQGKNPWYYYHHFCENALAKVVGAKKGEVAAMGSLTANLHFLMVSFYRPTKQRYKIIMEANAFPSDQYAIETQVKFHGFNPDEAIIEIAPREGEYTLRTEDILQVIDENKNELALVLFGGVNYLSGQLFDLKAITEAGHNAGAQVGFDLAHAAGNALLKLHDWNVDFACWCGYKYLNGGPGGVAGIFVHERHSKDESLPRFAGWWGNDESTRFDMKKGFHPQAGAAAWQVSNAPVFPLAIHRASLEIFVEAGINNLRKKSELLTAYLYYIIEEFNKKNPSKKLNIITPKNPADKGCQLSLIASANGKKLFNTLTKAGVIADWREPNVMRMAPVPLYNSFEDCFRIGEILNKIK
jgi:kynureninase